MNDYVLIDCGLIHKYAIKRNDIKHLEDSTFLTVEIIKDLSNYDIESTKDKIVFSNGHEKFVFKKVTNPLKWMLDEFV